MKTPPIYKPTDHARMLPNLKSKRKKIKLRHTKFKSSTSFDFTHLGSALDLECDIEMEYNKQLFGEDENSKKMYIDNEKQSSAFQKAFMEISDDTTHYSKTNTNYNLHLGSNVTLTWSGLFTILKNRWLNDEIINACIVLFQQNLENQHHNKIIVYKTFFQQYLLSNQLQQARNMLYGNNKWINLT